jgi:4'-phosphopantetheinyl transferase EntD
MEKKTLMLAEIVPGGVVTAEVFGGEYDEAELFPQEEAAIERAAPKRRREFAGVRACARVALAKAGLPAAPIVPDSSRAPIWPPGVTGSMTHCDGYRGCALGRTETIAAIGIDAEPHAALPDGVLPMVTSESERDALTQLGRADPGICYERILFSAKESVFKAWFPVTGQWLGFQQADLSIDRGGEFIARLLVPGPLVGGQRLAAYQGRWLVSRGLILTAVTVSATLASA